MIALCNHIRVTYSNPTHPASPAIPIAERQLGVLGELANMALEVSRGYAAAALSASHTVEVKLADEYYQSETERARVLAGAKDAADGFQKVARTLRLTLALELSTAEVLGELWAGTRSTPTTPAPNAIRKHPGIQSGSEDGIDVHREPDAGVGSDREAADSDRRESDSESLVDIEHPDRLPRGPFRKTVDELSADLGTTVNWTTWKVAPSSIKYQPLAPRPPGWSECRPPGSVIPTDAAIDREPALAP